MKSFISLYLFGYTPGIEPSAEPSLSGFFWRPLSQTKHFELYVLSLAKSWLPLFEFQKFSAHSHPAALGFHSSRT